MILQGETITILQKAQKGKQLFKYTGNGITREGKKEAYKQNVSDEFQVYGRPTMWLYL